MKSSRVWSTCNAPGLVALDMRVGAWRGDVARVARALARLQDTSQNASVVALGRFLLGETAAEAFDETLWRLTSSFTNKSSQRRTRGSLGGEKQVVAGSAAED